MLSEVEPLEDVISAESVEEQSELKSHTETLEPSIEPVIAENELPSLSCPVGEFTWPGGPSALTALCGIFRSSSANAGCEVGVKGSGTMLAAS